LVENSVFSKNNQKKIILAKKPIKIEGFLTKLMVDFFPKGLPMQLIREILNFLKMESSSSFLL
jgi:hypothetical protein